MKWDHFSKVESVHMNLPIVVIMSHALVIEVLSRSSDCIGQHQEHNNNVETRRFEEGL